MAAEGRGRGRPRSTSRADVSRVALRLFVERGFDETTLADVATAAGVGRTTLLRYVDSKSAVVWEGLETAVGALVTELATAPADRPWREALVEAAVAAQRYPEDDLEVLRLRLVLIGTVPSLRGGLVTVVEPAVPRVEAFVAARGGWAVGDAAPFVIAQTVASAVFTALTWWARSGTGDPRDVVRSCVQAVLGLAADPRAAG